MTAKEMFEELNFKYLETDFSIDYIYMGTKTDYICEISFYLTLKEYMVIVNDEFAAVDMQLNKAIQKQIEELGWIEDGRL